MDQGAKSAMTFPEARRHELTILALRCRSLAQELPCSMMAQTLLTMAEGHEAVLANMLADRNRDELPSRLRR
jgi:hypothetical protein